MKNETDELQEKLTTKSNEIVALLDGLTMSQVEQVLKNVENTMYLFPIQVK